MLSNLKITLTEHKQEAKYLKVYTLRMGICILLNNDLFINKSKLIV